MIEGIDIPNFGSFKNFSWCGSIRDSGGNVGKFKKLNILYGRNYSGKTTLSRVLRSLQTGELPDKYEAPSFSVSTSSGVVDHTGIPTTDHAIRVYNRDFVDAHLSFLRDSDGKITPFAVIGSDNKAIEREIADKERQLGSADGKTGLRHEHMGKEAEFQTAQRANTEAEQALHQKLFNKANLAPGGIKHNPLYKDVNYDIRKIKADVQTVREGSIGALPEQERKQKEALLSESPLPDIEKRLEFNPTISVLHEAANKLLSKKIMPSKPIQELLDDALLQAWTKEGIPHHKGKRKTCGFCGQPLPHDLWAKLDAHFSKESTDLETALGEHIEVVEAEKKAIDDVLTLDTSAFYSTFHSAFDDAKKLLEDEFVKYQASLDSIIMSLRGRLADIFTPRSVSELSADSGEMAPKIAAINALIEQNNKKTKSLEPDQNSARRQLRLSEIAQFVQDIDLEGEEKQIATLGKKADGLQEEVRNLRASIQSIEERIEELRIQLKDEKKGAETVNEYLNHYFGHEGLRLEAAEDTETSAYRFQILRGDRPAYNLSEGECSLVSFCYFIAKLNDAESKGKRLIVYLDDPVSSLDNNHIFFVFSLIESVIAAPEKDSQGKIVRGPDNKPLYRYEQLFISTHNLEFLKYLRKLSRPKKDWEQFLVVCKDGESAIELMPDYLRNYTTEFNHLFGELYTCRDPTNAATHYHCFYNFGNNLRRFLEAFLFFKFPFSVSDQEDYNRRIQMFFGREPGTEALVQRLTNEYSHLGGIFDRSMQPIDHAEISKVACFVLKKVKENDEGQFQCLLESIGKPDPFP